MVSRSAEHHGRTAGPARARTAGIPQPAPMFLRLAGKAALHLSVYVWFRHRHRRLVIEHMDGFPLIILPEVFNPSLFFSSHLLTRSIQACTIPPAARVLDMGTGSGVAALVAARRARCVKAVDVSPEAVKCARMNVLLNGMEKQVTVQQSDLFSALPGETFDWILFNPPFFAGRPRAWRERAWRSDGVVERFAAQLGGHLAPGGQALVVFSSEGCAEAGVGAFLNRGFTADVIARRRVLHEVLFLCRISQ